jgi:hypothetical protein
MNGRPHDAYRNAPQSLLPRKKAGLLPVINREQWAQMDVHTRLTMLCQLSLDQCLDILEEPLESASNSMLAAKVTVCRAILQTCMTLGIEASRSNIERERILAEMAQDLRRAGPRPGRNGEDTHE